MDYLWKTIRRAPVKSILFMILLGMASLVFCIGLNLLIITKKNTDMTKEAFDVIATIKSDSVNEDQWSEEYEIMRNLPNVSFYQPMQITATSDMVEESKDTQIKSPTLAYNQETAEGFYLNQQMIILFTYMGNDRIRIGEKLFGRSDCTGIELQVINSSKYLEPFINGVKYIAYGKFKSDYHGDNTGYTDIVNESNVFEIYDFAPNYYISNGSNFIENASNIGGQYNNIPDPLCGLEEYYSRSAYWDDLIKSLELSDNPLTIMSVNDVENLYDFHEGKAWIEQGNYFVNSDYKEGTFKCLIDNKTARESGLLIGDTLRLHIYISFYLDLEWGVLASLYSPSYPDYWGNNMGEAEFQIVGIFNANNSSIDMENESIVKNRMILIPEQTMRRVIGKKTMDEFRIGNYPRQFKYLNIKVDTNHIKNFLEEASKFHEIEVKVFDQGYSDIKSTIERFNDIAKLVILLAGLCTILISGLFVFIEYMKRTTDVQVMNALGCGRNRIRCYLLLAVLMISIPATLLGGLAGYQLSGTVIHELQEKDQEDQSIAYEQYYGESEETETILNYDIEWYSVIITIAGINFVILLFGFTGSYIITMHMNRGTIRKESRK